MFDFTLYFLTKHFLPLNCSHIKRSHFSPCAWATLPADSLGVCHGDNYCRLLLNQGVQWACVGGGVFAWLSVLVKSSHGLCCSSSLCQQVPYHFQVTIKKNWNDQTSQMLPSPYPASVLRHREWATDKEKKHLSILSTSHCECCKKC